MSDWFLEGYFSGGEKLLQLHLVNLPQVVGRDQNLALSITSPSISRNHAQIEQTNGQLYITDLRSSNGTFVNREKISSPTALRHGDVIHLGMTEMRVIDKEHSGFVAEPKEEHRTEKTRMMSVASLSSTFPSGIHELETLIANKSVQMVFQTIVNARDLSTCGYECLGRGASSDLPSSPMTLFSIAESFDLEVVLSELMRNQGIDTAAKFGLRGDILVNTHPSELKNIDRLLADLTHMRKRHPQLPITLEIHEQAVTDQKEMLQAFSRELSKLKIKLAFDDFGVGQSRLMELVDARPNLIKFDRVLIENIDKGDMSRYNLLKHLKDLASDLGIATLAECVGTEAEYKVCDKMGFQFYQGFYFSKPLPVEECLKAAL